MLATKDKVYRPSLLQLAVSRDVSVETQKVLLDSFMSGLVFRLVRTKWQRTADQMMLELVSRAPA